MDNEHTVDNEPSVKLYLRIGEKEGYIWLSSIYGSYNLESTIDIEDGEIAQFKCPHCFDPVPTSEVCNECGAPLVDFHLDDGGKVSICSRAGCKKHSIEFEDLSTALTHFYNAYEMLKYVQFKPMRLVESKEEPKVDKEVISSGTFLNSYCPHCKMSLINDNMVILKIEREDGECGILYMSPFLNVFTHNTTIKLTEKSRLKDIKCIYCDHTLVHQEMKCPVCESELVRFNVSAMRKVIDFYFCSRKGCRWHGLSDEDLNYIMLEDSTEW
jgi:ssDNA-binding Zn-finger/Zn-ribbon topoisomerase 1